MEGRTPAVPLLIEEPRKQLSAATLILAHGAGAAMDSPFMQTIATGLVRQGLRVVRFEFPYMRKTRADGKRRPPDGPRVLKDTWKGVIAEVGGEGMIIGGKSMGGRVASMVSDETSVAGLVCLGYPFHPPGRPEKTRTAHLESLQTPTLILQGTRDPFGKPDEVDGYRLSDKIRIHWIADGDHSFKPRVSSGRTLEQNLGEAVAAIVDFSTLEH
jgi:predicted alpha/beta-hydrolase family hydrolase